MHSQPGTISSPAMTTTDAGLFTTEPQQDLNERMLVITTPTRSPPECLAAPKQRPRRVNTKRTDNSTEAGPSDE